MRFIDGLHTLYAAGARVFVEVGPKKALHGFVEDVLAGDDASRVVHQPPQERRRGRRSTRRCAGCTRPGSAMPSLTPSAAAPAAAPDEDRMTAMTD